MVFHGHNDYVKQQKTISAFEEQSDELSIFWDGCKTTRGTISPTFHTRWRRGYEIREHKVARVRADHSD